MRMATPPGRTVARSHMRSCGRSTQGPAGHSGYDTFEFPELTSQKFPWSSPAYHPCPPFFSCHHHPPPYCQCGPQCLVVTAVRHIARHPTPPRTLLVRDTHQHARTELLELQVLIICLVMEPRGQSGCTPVDQPLLPAPSPPRPTATHSRACHTAKGGKQSSTSVYRTLNAPGASRGLLGQPHVLWTEATLLYVSCYFLIH